MSMRVAIIGSGNIGTDLMMKVMRLSDTLEMAAMVDIDAALDGLARARALGVATTADGIDGLIALPGDRRLDRLEERGAGDARQHRRVHRDHQPRHRRGGRGVHRAQGQRVPRGRGRGDYLPAYAGNLDIMTSAALRTAEKVGARRGPAVAA